MSKTMAAPAFVDRFGRRYPRLMGLGIGIMLVFVVLVELTTTDAPLVLYQAF
jgi:hypothetical protein